MFDGMIEIMDSHPWLYTLAGLILLALVALLSNLAVKLILVRGIDRLLGRTPIGQDAEIRKFRAIERFANIVPALVISSGIALVPGMPALAAAVIRNVANAFIIVALALALAAVLNIADTVYHRRPEARLRPIRGYVQVAKIAVYAVAAILVIATLIDRSPLILLSGLGAMAAVLILVFQDTLLSLVAGIQISSTDMVRVGDWIEMPAMNADGDVIEIALHTVRVQNFDKTITTIPIRRLVTDSFRNWRGMQESGGRRIKRPIFIDQTSIRFLTPEELDRLSRLRLLHEYLARRQEEIHAWNERLGEFALVDANTRRLTNIGTFRAYVQAYLQSHRRINQNMTLLVRQLEPGPSGLPLEIYCFTTTVVWDEYETIQSDLFDHLLALLPEFGLTVFQNPGGADFRLWAAALREGGLPQPQPS